MATPAFSNFPVSKSARKVADEGITVRSYDRKKSADASSLSPKEVGRLSAGHSLISPADQLGMLRGYLKPGSLAFLRKSPASQEAIRKEYDRVEGLRQEIAKAIIHKQANALGKYETRAFNRFYGELVGLLVGIRGIVTKHDIIEIVGAAEKQLHKDIARLVPPGTPMPDNIEREIGIGRGVANEVLCIRDRKRITEEQGIEGRYFVSESLDEIYKIDSVEMVVEEKGDVLQITIRFIQVKSRRPEERESLSIHNNHRDFYSAFATKAKTAYESAGFGKKVRYEYYSLIAVSVGAEEMDYSDEAHLGSAEFEIGV